jgi:dUTP pyrophosphatase
MSLRVRRLHDRALLPSRAYPGDAGFDLHAIDSAALAPGGRVSIGTGLALELPEGHAGLVLPRSGLAARHGITLVNAPGLIDSGYRGEVRVLLLNTDSRETFVVSPGDRIAQLVLVRVEAPVIEELEELAVSERGTGAFGSSGG